MKVIANIIRKITRPAISAAAGLALLATTTQAANITFEAKVPGYTGRGSGWVLVLPDLRPQLGGKVRWDDARGCYVTDRVERREMMRTTISPSNCTIRSIAACRSPPMDISR